jgi:hypothetical protein
MRIATLRLGAGAALGRVRVRPANITALALLAGLLVPAATSSAVVLLNDTWADGSRAETNLPNESAVYASSAADVTVGVGSLSYTQTTSSRRIHTHFAPAGSPVTVGVGEQLLATVEFLGRDGMGTSVSRNFRAGLFRDPDGTQVTADGYNDSGNSTWPNAEGYAAFFPLSTAPGSTQLFQIGKRTVTDGTQTSLLGAGGAYTQATSGGGVVTAALDTLYTLTMELDRVSTNQMNVTYSLADSSGVLATQTVVDSTNGGGEDPSQLGPGAPYISFDTLAFRFSAADGTANRLEFRRFQVELIPEPASLALLGVGGLALLRRRN